MREDNIQKDFVQKPIRTFESDIAEALGKGASLATIAIAEQKRRDEERNKNQNIIKEEINKEIKENKNEEEKEKTPEEKLEETEELAEKAKDNLQAEIENITGEKRQKPVDQTQSTQRAQNLRPDNSTVYKKPQLPINPAPDMVRSSPIVDIAPDIEREKGVFMENNIPIPIPPKPEIKKEPIIPKPVEIPVKIQEQIPVAIPVMIPKPAPKIEERPVVKPLPKIEPLPKPEVKIVKATISNIDEDEEENTNKEKRNILKPLITIVLIMLFIGGGIYGAYYVYENNLLSTTTPIEQKIIIPSIISPDKQMAWNIDSINKTQLIPQIYSQFKKNTQEKGKVLELILTQKVIDSEKQTDKAISGSTFIEKSGISMPDVLKRSLTDRWMLGSYSEEDGRITPFIILTTDFFQNTFAGMLSWEKSMPEDLSLILNYREKAKEIDLFASSTISSYFNIRGSFVDKQIMNRDLREFRASNGELLFLYSFINKNSLIITTTESSLIDIIKRVEKQTYIR